MERGRSARTTHVARVTSLPHEPSHNEPPCCVAANACYPLLPSRRWVSVEFAQSSASYNPESPFFLFVGNSPILFDRLVRPRYAMSPVSRKTAYFVIATSILIPISTAAIGLRMLASRKRKQCFKLHDYLAFFCFVNEHISRKVATEH
jgi:hypothetical protein